MADEQKRKEILDIARQLIEKDHSLKDWVVAKFPELEESEDEKIKNLIYCLIRDRSDNGKLLEHNGCPVEKALAWLEKQKPVEWSEEDWKLLDEVRVHIVGILGDKPDFTPNKIYEGFLELIDKLKFAKPQPKSEWNEEDERNLQGIIDEIEVNKNQAPDYDIATYDRFLSWLKSLRPQQKREWSEEDIVMHNDCICAINAANEVDYTAEEKERLTNWLSSLRPQKQWKPSEKQINALSHAVDTMAIYYGEHYYNNENHTQLKELLKQLKALV